ncbi:MAG: CBS domain-containing protein [Candidatus Glassbacteria bacterium]|nr:CBS domain-containing protein [Candidatus Glassbacteria bacterium]
MSVKARDIMTRKVIKVGKEMKVNDLIDLFIKHNFSSAPVVDKKGKLVGIVTKTDIIGHFMDLDLDLTVKLGLKDLMDTTPELEKLSIETESQLNVGSIMSPDPVTAKETMAVEQLAQMMLENKIHRLIVMKGRKLTGLVSTIDIISHVAGTKKS